MSIVYVTNLKTGTVARQTARTEGTQTALVSDFSKRVGLVHKLRKRICTEECVDYRRNSLSVDQIFWLKHFVVAHIHAFADSASHTIKTYTELVIKLFTHSAHSTVAQVVDIVNVGLAVDKADEVLDDLDDIFTSEHTNVVTNSQSQFFIDAETAHITQVITLIREEQVGDNFTSTCIIRWFGVTQLAIDVCDSLFF